MAATSPTYQLSDAQWEQIKDLLPKNGQRGGQWKDHRLLIDASRWALSDGGRWRNVPERFGPWQTAYDRFRNWTRRGLWDRLLRRLQARKMHNGDIDWQLFAIDGTVIRAHQSAAGAAKKKRPAGEPEDHALGRSQGGFGTKLHLICDGAGPPLAVAVSPGQEHETRPFVPLLEEVTAWPEQPEQVAGDKGYAAGWIRDWLKERGIEPVIPYKRNETGRKRKFNQASYRRRNLVERCVNSLKWFRRVATRYEKLALHYLAMVTLAIIFRLL
jgi:transposase